MINYEILSASEGNDLEDEGSKIFSALDLTCFGRLNNVRLIDIDPNGLHSRGEHLEIDYIIPFNNYCLIGEITARSNEREIRRKYSKFRAQFDLLRNLDWNGNVCATIGIPRDKEWKFSSITEFRGFFISTKFERVDVDLSNCANIVCFFKSDLSLLATYGNCIGKYYKNHFLHLLDIRCNEQNAIRVNRTHHNLMVLQNKKIVSYSDGLVNLYSFDISPYRIIPSSVVYRRDLLPNLSSTTDFTYQRPLIIKKIYAIRQQLLTKPNFVFPNSILVILSEDSDYDGNQLIIPQSPDSISIIDGQHRLFSYANQKIEDKIGETSKIMVTAIQIPEGRQEDIIRLSAQAFVEINQNQTRITSTHIDSIGYDILGKIDSRAISAKVLLRANVYNRRSAIYCLFKTNQTATGVIQPGTVITNMKSIFNLDRIKRLTRLEKTSRYYQSVLGYRNLFEVADIEELMIPETLIEKGISCTIQYFNILRDAFNHDFPNRAVENRPSTFYFAKFIAAWMKLLGKFINEGLNWEDVCSNVSNIKTNVLLLRDLESYESILFIPENELIPNSRFSAINDYRFLMANRVKPVSIQEI